MNMVVQALLRPLLRHAHRSDLEEVAVNRPGEIWLKEAGGGWWSLEDPDLTADYLLRLCACLANVSGQRFHRRRWPLLYATLPSGHRFTAIAGRSVRYERDDTEGIAVTIRLFDGGRRIGFERYGLYPSLPLCPLLAPSTEPDVAVTPREDLLNAIAQREAILISGATATGKTSFLNAIVEHLPATARILTVEDTREVIIPHPNRIHLMLSRTEAVEGLGFAEIVDAVVRLTPDIIICGEIGISNAPGVFRLMTTGHTNFLATIHASSPEGALRAFYQNLAQSQPGLEATAVFDILRSTFGRIVQLDREGHRRQVVRIDRPMAALSSGGRI